MYKENIANKNTTVLAYLGDSVYELYVRKHVLETGQVNADRLHRSAVRFVKAEAQANVIKSMLEDLTEEELSLVKRARNKKTSTKPKNADPIDYKWATAFEALLGFLYLSENHSRIEEIISQAIHQTENNRSIKNFSNCNQEVSNEQSGSNLR
jgi:Uncharacterized protein conserved in bacteria